MAQKSPEESRQQESNFFVLLFTSVIIIGISLYFLKDDIGLVLYPIMYFDLTFASLIDQVTNGEFFFNYRNYKNDMFDNFYTIFFQNGEYIISLTNGTEFSFDTVFHENFKYFHIFYSFISIYILYYILSLINSVGVFSNDLRITNKKMQLFFNDDILQDFDRKTIKIAGKEEFASGDYYPTFIPEDNTFKKKYVDRSILLSLNELNDKNNINRFNKLEKIWNDIINSTEGNANKYNLIYWSYLDEDEMNEADNYFVFFETGKINKIIKDKLGDNDILISIKEYLNEYHEGEKSNSIIIDDLVIYHLIKRYKNKKTVLYIQDNSELPTFLSEKKHKEKIINILSEKNKKEVTENGKQLNKLKLSELEIKKIKQVKNMNKEEIKKNIKLLETKQDNFYCKSCKGKGKKNNKECNVCKGKRFTSTFLFKQPIIPKLYILNRKANKLENFKTRGSREIIKILLKYIIVDYKASLETEIKNMKEIISTTKDEAIIAESKAIINDIENSLNKNNKESRMSEIEKLQKIYNFEETYLLGLWEYGMTLTNLPTGRLSIIKKENQVLWYALTSLGRPFNFTVALPILLMKKIEEENYENLGIEEKEELLNNSKTIKEI
jgi:hypothetical protein